MSGWEDFKRLVLPPKRSEQRFTLSDLAQLYMKFDGVNYVLGGTGNQLGGKAEEIPAEFEGYTRVAYKGNGIVFACMQRRASVFAQARFQFQQRGPGRSELEGGPGRLFGTPALRPLEEPWPGGTTSDLLARAIQDADLGGNSFWTLRRGRMVRLRPDWVTIVLGGPKDAELGDLDVEVVGYAYWPGGKHSGRDPVPLRPETVAHFMPIPDPTAQFRGMSWLTPIVREVMADGAARDHKLQFFENGATPNLIVKSEISDPEKFERFIDIFKSKQEGLENAYATLFLAGGMDATVVGADMKQIDFKVTQGAGETRIAAAAGVPPIIAGLSEGLESATYSNYGQARRAFSDATIRPLWENFASSMGRLISAPGGSALWYDDRFIAFVQEDKKDEAEIQATQAGAINTFITAGFTADSAVDAVASGDYSRLKHTGMFSVQLQKPGEQQDTVPAMNGTGDPAQMPMPQD